MQRKESNESLRVLKPGDPLYKDWNKRGVNLRYESRPAGIIPVSTIEQLTEALQQTASKNQRLAIRGGGHCLENFVDNPAIEVIIDMSMMKGIRFDDEMNAIEVTAGTTLGEMHQKLCSEWGIVLPVGEHPEIGIGGHIAGGAFGFLCRKHGLAVDYLYAVELLYVNQHRQVEKVTATRDENDENRELWWAHTGGGAGNFGVVTRYWFRSSETKNNNPSQMLPAAPSMVETVEIDWDWKDITESKFIKLVGNFCNWSHQNAGSGIASDLFATMHLFSSAAGKIQLKAVVADATNTETILRGLLYSLDQDADIPYVINRKKQLWLDFALHPFPDIFSGQRAAFKVKDAFLIQPYSLLQLKVAFKYLTEKIDTPGAFIGLATYGGKVNTIGSGETATSQRSAILTTACSAGWKDPSEEQKYLTWLRDCYHDLYMETGGVPVPGEKFGGCIIAHPDNDLIDPNLNRSGVPWHTLYYQDNYPRLQLAKNRWDPLNIFHHALSVKPD